MQESACKIGPGESSFINKAMTRYQLVLPIKRKQQHSKIKASFYLHTTIINGGKFDAGKPPPS